MTPALPEGTIGTDPHEWRQIGCVINLDSTLRHRLYRDLLEAVATHRVADRPDRFEPRQRKRRQKKYDRMMKPRHEVKRDILNGVTEN